MPEQHIGIVNIKQHRLCHTIMDQWQQLLTLCFCEHHGIAGFECVDNTALNPLHFFQSTVMHNIAGLAGPG